MTEFLNIAVPALTCILGVFAVALFIQDIWNDR